MSTFINQLFQNLADTTWLEFIAVVFGIISVWLAKQENILLYPTGIISTIIFVYIYVIKTGLYADGIVNAYYTYMSFIGWYVWNKNINAKGQNLQISYSNKKDLLIIGAFTIVMFSVLYTLLVLIMPKYLSAHFTPSTVPVFDSINAALSFSAMWLMNKKKMEHWLFWVVVNIISIPLNAYKGLAFTSVQYIVFLLLAIVGFIAWRKKLKHA